MDSFNNTLEQIMQLPGSRATLLIEQGSARTSQKSRFGRFLARYLTGDETPLALAAVNHLQNSLGINLNHRKRISVRAAQEQIHRYLKKHHAPSPELPSPVHFSLPEPPGRSALTSAITTGDKSRPKQPRSVQFAENPDDLVRTKTINPKKVDFEEWIGDLIDKSTQEDVPQQVLYEEFSSMELDDQQAFCARVKTDTIISEALDQIAPAFFGKALCCTLENALKWELLMVSSEDQFILKILPFTQSSDSCQRFIEESALLTSLCGENLAKRSNTMQKSLHQQFSSGQLVSDYQYNSALEKRAQGERFSRDMEIMLHDHSVQQILDDPEMVVPLGYLQGNPLRKQIFKQLVIETARQKAPELGRPEH